MAKHLFSEEQEADIVSAIKEAELNTSGEIRVHLEKSCPEDVMDRAAFIFEKLKIHKTELRNGVLFYQAVKDHKYAILGDAGLNAKVPEGFWDEIKDLMLDHFRKEDFSGGLVQGILKSGDQLKVHFPYQTDDINELPDDISFG
jgi:uncharacterized membrane protein